MGDLSKNFSRSEWTCKCPDPDCPGKHPVIDAELVNTILQQSVRDHFSRPVTITPNGGFRCPGWNALKGGAKHSQHMKGTAADIHVAGVSPKEVYDYLCKKFSNQYGFGLYDTFVHVDSRPTKARWDYRKGV